MRNQEWIRLVNLSHLSVCEKYNYVFLSVWNFMREIMYKHIKRMLDIIFALVLIVLLAVPMLLLMLTIIATSRGPVLFKQVRFGLGSEPFVMYKFRTMVVDSPEISNQNFSNRADFLTPIGHWLRKTSLDELPQVWNVLKGDMSFIGPRPLAGTDSTVVKLRRTNGADAVRPGITGLAQINGRNTISDQEKAFFDSVYAQHYNFSGDTKIMANTVLSTLRCKNIDSDIEVPVDVQD